MEAVKFRELRDREPLTSNVETGDVVPIPIWAFTQTEQTQRIAAKTVFIGYMIGFVIKTNLSFELRSKSKRTNQFPL